MKIRFLTVSALIFCAALDALGAVHYVDLNSQNPQSPFTGWATAATSIQEAIDAAVDGEAVWVTNGIYRTGGKVMAGDLTNRVAIDKAVAVQSVNGPWATVIQGAGAANGAAAVRCAWLTNGAALVGFTLQAGATRTSGDVTNLESGGGAWCASADATVANCLIVSNTAWSQGGAVFQGTIDNSLLRSNRTSASVGAAYAAKLNNCTVVSNAGYGAYSCTLTNCIVYYNDGNFYSATPYLFAYCCTTPMPAGGVGNFTGAPQLFADGIHLTSGSPCVAAGVNLATGTDIFGNAWGNPPSVGCAEWRAGPLVTAPRTQLTGDPVGFTFGNVAVASSGPFSCWWLHDGVQLQDNGHYGSTRSTNLVAIGLTFADAGAYQLVVSNADGVVTSAVAQVVVHCVDAAGVTPVPPYYNWDTAATNIQDAIEAASSGEVVLVTNGLYASGGKSKDGVITNRVTLDKAITLQSVNGAAATIVQGAWDPQITNGPAAVRCAWLTNAATISGFTLRGGATRAITNNPPGTSGSGGGVLGGGTNVMPALRYSTNMWVVSCVLEGNSASTFGGGAYNVVMLYCTLTGNLAAGSATSGDGGGAYSCQLRNCLVTGNSANGNGGGVSGSYTVAQNCTLTKNSAIGYGGGAYGGILLNCTLTGNILPYAYLGGSGVGAGANGAKLTNCVIWGNFQMRSYPGTNYTGSTLAYCCADPLPSGPGNIFADPQLLADGIHLSTSSPCRGAGTNSVVFGVDWDNQPWGNPPSIGCDEWEPTPLMAGPILYQIDVPVSGLSFVASVAGQEPFTCFWTKDGVPIHDDARHFNSQATNLVIKNFSLEDAGAYQVVVTNSIGVVTSTVTRLVIHGVDAGSANPVAPYSTWSTAAATIQDAIDAASAGEIVLVTNGIYATGGRVELGDLTNRVALDKPLTVMSVNGCWTTIIQGAWDPALTNGPGAVRCAWLTNGAVLNGFTLRNGATRQTDGGLIGSSRTSGGGAWCASTNALILNCVLSNNAAVYGGALAYGTLNNSLVVYNVADIYGGAALYSTLRNSTVLYNTIRSWFNGGAGTYNSVVRNCILLDNINSYPVGDSDNYYYFGSYTPASLSYSCTYPPGGGPGNVDGQNNDPQFLDLFHIASTSLCRGAGSALYTSGVDLDGEAWASPPSMGCDEVVPANLIGPLSVSIKSPYPQYLVTRPVSLWGEVVGRASRVEWSFGDGPVVTNLGTQVYHRWLQPGDYTVTFTAYNNDNPGGVSTNLLIHIPPLQPAQLQAATVQNNMFTFQFTGQSLAYYSVQYATNLNPPVVWQTLQSIYNSTGQVFQIQDPVSVNEKRFYRVQTRGL